MRWENQRESANIEDRRTTGGFGVGGRHIGIGAIVLALVGWGVFGINPLTTLGVVSEVAPQKTQASKPRPANDKAASFVATMLASTEDVWADIFKQSGMQYTPPSLVLYRDFTPTACGTGQSAMGPFYCPGDKKVYLDMEFFDTMAEKLGAPGQFAQAYVIAHEVGHHVQNLLGITGQVDGLHGRISQVQNNALSVRVELQADCFAGIWAKHSDQSKQWLDAGDIESAVNAAEKIGDDTLQKRSQGYVVPDSFTHGSSAQRQRWFMQGYKNGTVQSCNTFDAQSL